MNENPVLKYDAVAGMAYVDITPVMQVRNRPEVNRLYLKVREDDLMMSAIVRWELRAFTQVNENTVTNEVIATDSMVLNDEGGSYAACNHNAQYLFTLVANREDVTIVNE